MQAVPTKEPRLFIGKVIKDWKSLHLLEASLRSSARLEGRFLMTYSQRGNYLSTAAPTHSVFVACVLGEQCPFYVQFAPFEQTNEAGWICQLLCTKHTCSSMATNVSDDLAEKLAFWVSFRIRLLRRSRSSHHMIKLIPAETRDQGRLHEYDEQTNPGRNIFGMLALLFCSTNQI